MLILITLVLLGVSSIQKIQSNDSDTKTVIIDRDRNQVEPVDEDETIYGG